MIRRFYRLYESSYVCGKRDRFCPPAWDQVAEIQASR
jgi:hypothetical protein